MTIRKELEKQGVPSALLDAVEKTWNTEKMMDEERCSRPPFLYYGKKVWTEAISALLAGENLLLVGSKATGKNILAENLSYLFQRPRWNISFHINTDASSLLGTDTFRQGEVQFRKGPVIECAEQGGFGILDEINMARNDAVAVLHATLDHRRIIDLPGYKPIRLSKETRFIATMNYGYIGTRELNEALTSRFMVIQVPPIQEEALQHLLHEAFPTLKEEYAKQFAGLFYDLQKKSEQAEISTKSVDLRGLLASIRLMRQGLNPFEALTMGLLNKTFDPFEQEIVRDVLRLRLEPNTPAEVLFHHVEGSEEGQ